jgi:hypothetical protein
LLQSPHPHPVKYKLAQNRIVPNPNQVYFCASYRGPIRDTMSRPIPAVTAIAGLDAERREKQ